ncbi:hypothetical protein BH09PSE4_BH09PSE4_21100 [soil metagenome]
MLRSFVPAAALALAFASAAHAQTPGTPIRTAAGARYAAETARTRALTYAFLDQLYGKMDLRGAFMKYVDPGYIQHHPGMADGRDAAIASLEPLFRNPNTRISVKQVLVDGDRIAVEIVGHMSPEDPGSVVINIFKWKNGKIIEHWDVTQAITGDTPSGHKPY